MKTFKETFLEYGDEKYIIPSDSLIEELYTTNPSLDTELHHLLFEEQVIVANRVPKGHEAVAFARALAIPELYIKYVQGLLAYSYDKHFTFGQLLALYNSEENEDLHIKSRGGLTNIFNRIETKLKLADKERPRKKEARARQKAAEAKGLKKHKNVTEKSRKQVEKMRSIKKDHDRIRKADKEKALAKASLAKKTRKSGLTAKAALVGSEAREGNLESRVKKEELPQNKKILYTPTPKQILFHEAGENIVLYGGAAGGGKSYAVLIDALRYCSREMYRGLIIRKSSPMLKELIGVSRSLYPKAFPGAKYNKSENVWYFPSGATIEFGYLDKEEDVERYQGLPYSYIAFDEVQHQRSPDGFIYLMSRLRSADPEITCYMRCTANPGGAPWVKEMFIDPAEPNVPFERNGLSYKFIPASLTDNPHLDTPQEGEELSPYRKMLMALPEIQRKQLLEGDWTIDKDTAFVFNRAIHTTNETPPLHWSHVCAMDYGYNDPAAVIWAAIDPVTGQCIVYRELESIKHYAFDWGKAVRQSEKDNFEDMLQIDRIIDWSLFKTIGHSGPSIREDLFRLGIAPRPADRNREAGWNQVHTRLAINEHTEEPMLLIHSSCELLIDQLESAKIDEKKPDDIDQRRLSSKGRMHHWDLLDALRYLLMSRPRQTMNQANELKFASNGFDKYRSYFK